MKMHGSKEENLRRNKGFGEFLLRFERERCESLGSWEEGEGNLPASAA
jgi:hypothetical protein